MVSKLLVNLILFDIRYIDQVKIYLFKVSNRNNRKMCEICSKLTARTLERCQRRHSGAFIVNFEHISSFSSVSIVDIERVFICWGRIQLV